MNECEKDCLYNIGGYCTLKPGLEDAQKQKDYVRVKNIEEQLKYCKKDLISNGYER